ncbi:MAG: aldolase/citrate lyase family protein [Hydrogenophaga sp.]|nr:aldolase/citrate lyase family protein [Hydrogenophaga sp.]
MLLPRVRGADDLRAAARAAYYPPLGARGVSASTRAAGYSAAGLKACVNKRCEQILLVPIIEHPDAVAHIDAICALPEVLAIAFGVNDLSFAMGHGFAMLESAEVQAAHAAVLAAARRHGVAVMGSPREHDTTTAQQVVDEGASALIYGPDLSLFQKMCAQMATAHRAVAGLPRCPG